jgi:hypothetical protein
MTAGVDPFPRSAYPGRTRPQGIAMTTPRPAQPTPRPQGTQPAPPADPFRQPRLAQWYAEWKAKKAAATRAK